MTPRDRPISIAMLALGGQGGGVLTKWLVDIAESEGHLAQSTYVAGVAQRTGATVYCIEMFPKVDIAERGDPVFTPYPVPGDVDLVIAGELAETGRAIQKGFVTPNVTTLLASTHRVYSIAEKSALGDGIIDQSPVISAARKAARTFLAFDMERIAEETGSIVSAVMLGAIAGSGALPFDREAYVSAIKRGGRAIESNLCGFDAGYRAAVQGDVAEESTTGIEWPAAEGPAGAALLARCKSLPAGVSAVAAHGALRALEFQDKRYAEDYLDRVDTIVAFDGDKHGFDLSETFARNLALQMCYEDTIRVAELKTSSSRFERVRGQLQVSDEQPVYFIEYFHPRIEELCDTLPASVGRWLLSSRLPRRWLTKAMSKGRNVSTNKIGGYLLLSTLARLKRWRRGTYRFVQQHSMLSDWQARIQDVAPVDYDYALALASCIEIVRGYGETWERGHSRFTRSLAAVEHVSDEPAVVVNSLHRAALEDENGEKFDNLIAKYEAT